MSRLVVDQIAAAVLYEGYILYPYRPTSVKNQQRWTFGGIYPREYVEGNPGADNWRMRSQSLLRGDESTAVRIAVRFLQLTDRTVEKRSGEGFQAVGSLEVNGRDYYPWQEAVERTVEIGPVAIGELLARGHCERFGFAANQKIEALDDTARLVRRQERIDGSVEVLAEARGEGVYRVSLTVWNESGLRASQRAGQREQARGYTGDSGEREPEMSRDAALVRSLVSTHFILTVAGGGFVSVTDPPAELAALAGECEQVGCWPVLVGEMGASDTMLVSPIILPDYPEVAAESPGDLFDGCEIDEILTLRILTMTEDEKRQAAAADPRAQEMLRRTEALAREQLMNLHGAIRGMRPVASEGEV